MKAEEAKQLVATKYKRLSDQVSEIIQSLNATSLPSQSLKEMKDSLIDSLNHTKSTINADLKYSINNMYWDSLVIAFFGETNAGKSTIIEALRILLNDSSRNIYEGDGLIVGDGQHDYTKDYHEYNLTINGKSVVLIDVPGIEGNEKVFKDGIRKALAKAHTVFYVNGHNKNADKGTAEKIKEYLGNWVKSAVIYNVRGSSDSYEFEEDRRELVTPKVTQVVNLLNSSFREWLGKNYDRTIPVQGFLAMSSEAKFSPSRQDLIKNQKKIFGYFSEDDKANPRLAVRKFSGIDCLINYISTRSNNYLDEIIDANLRKVHSHNLALRSMLDNCVKQEESIIQSYVNRLNVSERDNQQARDTVLDSLKRTIHTGKDQLLNELRQSLIGIARNGNFSKASSIENRFNLQLKELIDTQVSQFMNSLAERINENTRRLEGIPSFSPVYLSSSHDFKISSNLNGWMIKDADSISFGDVGTSLSGTAAGAATGAIFGPIGAVVGGFIGFMAGNAKAASNQTERAVKEAKRQADKKKTKIDVTVNEYLETLSRKTHDEVHRINYNIKSSISQISWYRNALNEARVNIAGHIN